MKLKTLLAVAAAALTLAACNKQPEPAPTPETTLSVNPTSYEFKADDVNVAQEFTVTSNAAWQATAPADVDWFTVAEGNGKGNGKFKVTVTKKNEAQEARSAKVTVKADTKTVEVAVSQAAAPLPPADPTKIKTAQQFVDELLLKDHSTIASRDTTYTIEADLDFKDVVLPGYDAKIQYFYANINGQNHSILNYVGDGPMFRSICGTVQDLTFDKSCSAKFTNHSGGILCYENALGYFKNIVNNAPITIEPSVSETSHFGGIMGVNRAYVEDCVNNGEIAFNSDVKKQARVGGIVGSFAGNNVDGGVFVKGDVTVMKNCANNANITITFTDGGANAQQEFVGGICGFFETKDHGEGAVNEMSGCVNKGAIINATTATIAKEPKLTIGGVIACRKGGTNDETGVVANCSNTGELDGGINSIAIVGGLIGEIRLGSLNMKPTFDNCQVSCDIKVASATNEFAGIVCGKFMTGTGTAGVGLENAPVYVAKSSVSCNGEKTEVNESNLETLRYGSNEQSMEVATEKITTYVKFGSK